MIPLSKAVWCADCCQVSASRHHHCDVCGSTALTLVSRIYEPVTSEAVLTTGQHAADLEILERLWRKA